MAKKKSPKVPDTVVTIRLPGEGGAERIADIVAMRGKNGKVEQIRYASLADLVAGLNTVLGGLLNIERNPLPDIQTSKDDEYKPNTDEETDTSDDDNTDADEAPTASPEPIAVGDTTALIDEQPANQDKSPSGKPVQKAMF